MWSKNKKLILWLSIVCVVVIAALAVVLAIYINSKNKFNAAKNSMDPDGTLTLQAMEDGSVQVQWPAGKNATDYEVQVLDEKEIELYSEKTKECSCILKDLPKDQPLLIRVTCCNQYDDKTREGDKALEVRVHLAAPEITDLQWEADVATATVSATFNMDQGDLCRVYMATGEEKPVLVEELTQGALSMHFGEDEKYTVPTHEAPLHFTFQLEKKSAQVFYCGDTVEGFTVTREDLLGAVLTTECVDNGDNSYTLSWNETKGDHYEVRISQDGQSWTTLETIPADQERTYTSRHLDPFKEYHFWVLAVGGQTLPDSEYAAHSEPVSVTTGAKLMYSTIWPLMEQNVYADTQCTQLLGTAAAGSAWCVIGMEGNLFKIRYDDQDGYIDSTFCMINLPEYIGDLCIYNITNSYYSIYMVHEFGISRVSGTVITGYEDIKVGEGEYLVPFLYPSAQKLIKAAQEAKKQGYTLKIYDSYRPKNATDNIYSLTNAILDTPVPVSTFSGKRVNDLHLLDWEYEEEEDGPEDVPEEVPEEKPQPSEPPSSEEESSSSTPEPQPEPEPEAPATKKALHEKDDEPWIGLMEGLTYKILMTNDGEYLLSAFLAPGNSRHNFGVALDLTLVDRNGNELAMQTSMHDLSWYSASKRNNGNALTLYRIMTGAGFKDLFSEWWHFQDNEIYEAYELQPLKTGVTWQCWVADENGWRYRLADGSFYKDCTQTIDGQRYSFDENGYVLSNS